MFPVETRIRAVKMLRNIYVVTLVDCVCNFELRERLGLTYIIEVKMQKHAMLRWLGYVVRMTNKRFTDRYTIGM